MTLTEISQLTGVSRPTLYSLKNRHSASSADDGVYALLSSLGGLGPQTVEQVASVAGIAEEQVNEVLKTLVAQGLLKQLIGYSTPAASTTYLVLTQLGAKALEQLLTERMAR